MNVPPTDDYPKYSLVSTIHQSPPIDFSAPYSTSTLSGKTFLITGGASGFGRGFAKEWASHGANVIIGDINKTTGPDVAATIRSETGNPNVHFVYCDVTDWASQVAMFKEAVRLSPHGGIDCVVANAGIAGIDDFERPTGLDAEAPPKPVWKTFEVNIVGVLYTAHLAQFWLPKNPGSEPASPTSDPEKRSRDRHLLLMGSMASLAPIPGQPLYAVSKHGVVGLFRTLRSTCFFHGIRTNILCPYFIDTPILPTGARLALAGGATGKPEDVVEAGTRLAADTRIVGRSAYIGPRMQVAQDDNGEWQLAVKNGRDVRTGTEKAIWEAFAHDYDDSEVFGRNLVRLVNAVTRMRGWFGWLADIFRALKFALTWGILRRGPR